MSHIRQNKIFSMKQWLKMLVEDENGICTKKNGNSFTHAECINYFIHTIKDILDRYGYVIENENEFKNEITQFVYSYSDNNGFAH